MSRLLESLIEVGEGDDFIVEVSTQRLSTNRMSMGTSMVARTRAKQGRSQRRSTVRLRMVPSVVVERQLSKVMGGTGAEVGVAVSVVSEHPQELQEQVFTTCA